MFAIKFNKYRTIAVFIAIAGTIIAIYLMPFSRDYINYKDIFDQSANAKSISESVNGIELTYSTVAYFTKSLIITSFLLGIIALSIKLIFFSKYKRIALIATAYYFARFFIVHDVTQVRISFAIAMLLVAFNHLVKRRYFYGIVFLIIAAFSHTSTVVYIPIVVIAGLINKPNVTLKSAFKIIVFLVPLILIVANYIISKIPIENIVSNLPDARLANYYSEDYDLIVPSLLTDVFFYLKVAALISLIFWKQANGKDDSEIELHARWGIIFLFSLTLFVLFHNIYAIAARFADIAAPFECLILSLFITRLSKPNKIFFTPFASSILRIALTLIIVGRLIIAQTYLFT